MKKRTQRRRASKRRTSTPRRAGYYVSPAIAEALEDGELTHQEIDGLIQRHHAARRGQPMTSEFKFPGIPEYYVVTTDPSGKTTLMLNDEWDERTAAPSSRRKN